MTEHEKTYRSEGDECTMDFVRRVVNDQSDREPLRIVEQLVEIVVDELKDRPCDISAAVSVKRMKVTLRHNGKPIDERIMRLMADHTGPCGLPSRWRRHLAAHHPPRHPSALRHQAVRGWKSIFEATPRKATGRRA
jgi:hypothetical protein